MSFVCLLCDEYFIEFSINSAKYTNIIACQILMKHLIKCVQLILDYFTTSILQFIQRTFQEELKLTLVVL